MQLSGFRLIAALCAVLTFAGRSFAQEGPAEQNRVSRPWPHGEKGAVSLSYDDSVPVHHRVVAPLLEKHGLRGTFYLSIANLESPEAWKGVASRGHELGNHSLFHPCRRDPSPAYAWLPEHYDLGSYTPGRFRDELATANLFLELLDGGRPRTYGICTNLTIGRGPQEQPMDPILETLFVAGRGTLVEDPVDPSRPHFMRLGHRSGDGKTFEQIRAEILSARERGAWIIYMFHGVGRGTHGLFIEEEEHRKMIEWLGTQKETLWTAPVVDVALHLGAPKPRK